MNKTLTLIFAALTGCAAAQAAAPAYDLWYNAPAQLWTEALPIGNGRLGAMVFGTPAVERLQLNEETIWAGRPNDNANPEALDWIPRIRQLVFDGKYREAQEAANQHVMAKTNSGMPYQPFGDLYISFAGQESATAYRRSLSLDSALTRVSYTAGGTRYTREAFASLTDSVIAIHLTAQGDKRLYCTLHFTSPQQEANTASEDIRAAVAGSAQTAALHTSLLQSTAGWHEGLKGKITFTGRCCALTPDGQVASADGAITVSGATEATIYIAIATNFRRYDDISANDTLRSLNQLTTALRYDYQTLKARHTAAYRSQYCRTQLDLGPDLFPQLPTDERVAAFAGHKDPYLAALYFQFGRYLLISSSQPGCQPPTLQGLWNDKMLPSWDSKYTCNINLEMNYWPAESCGLGDLTEPLFRLTREVAETGHRTAHTMYGADGWVLHHNTDLWRTTGAVDHAPSGMWLAGGAWLSQHIWEHYLYTLDLDFLAAHYPVMLAASRFFNQVLVRHPTQGYWVVAPSSSPENEHPGGATTAAGVTMDNSLLRDLFTHTAEAARLLGRSDALIDSLRDKLSGLPPYKIGRWGQLQEWLDDWDKPDDTHRHVSHLYGLYPSSQISPLKTPDLAEAAKTSLIHRGDPSTGWSMGWKVCLWARLLDGNHAMSLIRSQLSLVRREKKRGGTYPNLFDAHPPFQIDGNFGCAAGISEMLLQSQNDLIFLLPALPDDWADGSVSGLRARGNVGVSIDWAKGRLAKATLLSPVKCTVNLASYTPLKAKGLKAKPAKTCAGHKIYFYELTLDGRTLTIYPKH